MGSLRKEHIYCCYEVFQSQCASYQINCNVRVQNVFFFFFFNFWGKLCQNTQYNNTQCYNTCRLDSLVDLCYLRYFSSNYPFFNQITLSIYVIFRDFFFLFFFFILFWELKFQRKKKVFMLYLFVQVRTVWFGSILNRIRTANQYLSFFKE